MGAAVRQIVWRRRISLFTNARSVNAKRTQCAAECRAECTCKRGAGNSRLLSTVLPGFSDTLVAGGIKSPSAMAVSPDGRVFIAEQGGVVKLVESGLDGALQA